MATDCIDLDALIAEADALPALPATAARLAKVLADEDWDVAEVIRAVELDPSLTSRILAVANSVAFGGYGRIGRLDQAVIRLGAGTVLAVAVGREIRRQMSVPLAGYGLDADGLFRHSVAALLALDVMRRMTGVRIPAEASTAALLHDIGKLVLGRHLVGRRAELVKEAHEKDVAQGPVVEREAFATHHAEVGGFVARHWQLPSAIVWGIAHHHAPYTPADSEAHGNTAYAVCFADATAYAAEQPGEPPLSLGEQGDRARARFGIDAARVRTIIDFVREELADVLSSYG